MADAGPTSIISKRSIRRAARLVGLAPFLLLLGAAATPHERPSAAEAAFLRENEAAMMTMMSRMQIAPSGDVDRDFVASMVPHHQGAIDMALAELRHGRDQQLRRIAQEIIVNQQQEIAAMRLALGQPLPPATAAPTQASAGATSHSR